MRILALGAHPDDIEIFMFGLLAACQRRGDDVGWVIATDGAAGAGPTDGECSRIRRQESREAAALLGVEPVFLDGPDGSLRADANLVGRIADLLVGADLVVTHAAEDYHPDHRALSLAVRDAAGFKVPVLACEPLGGAGFAPTHLVDVSDHMDLKRAAICCHFSQRPERFVEIAEVTARFRALQANGMAGRHAEAYRFEPRFPFADVRGLLPPAPPIRPF